MKNNKKFALGSVLALALSVGVLAPNLTNAAGEEAANEEANKPAAEVTETATTNDAPGKTDSQKLTEAQGEAKKKLRDAGVAFDDYKHILEQDLSKNSVYDVQKNTEKILADHEAKVKEMKKTDLGKAKLAAKEELRNAGIQSSRYNDAIDNAPTVYDVEKVKNENLEWAKNNLTTIDDFNKKEEEAKKKEEAAKKPLADAKANAKAELKKAGIQESLYKDKIDNAETLYDVEKAKQDVLAWAEENLTTIDEWNEKEAAKGRKLTIDEWLKLQEDKEKKEETPSEPSKEETPSETDKEETPSETPKEDEGTTETPAKEDEKVKALADAKEAAIAELKEAGITSDFLLGGIRKANTVEGVEALKDALLKSHADSKEETPADPKEEETEKPAEEDNKKPELKFEDLLKDEDALKDYLTKLKEEKEEGKLTDEEYKKIGDRFLELLKDKDSSEKFVKALKGDTEATVKKVAKDAKKDNKKANKAVKNDYVKKHDNVKTGVAGLTGVVGTLAAAGAALFASKKRK